MVLLWLPKGAQNMAEAGGQCFRKSLVLKKWTGISYS